VKKKVEKGIGNKVANTIAKILVKTTEGPAGVGYPPPCMGIRFQPKRPQKPQSK